MHTSHTSRSMRRLEVSYSSIALALSRSVAVAAKSIYNTLKAAFPAAVLLVGSPSRRTQL